MKDKDIIQALRVCADPELNCSECNLNENQDCTRQATTWAVFRLEELKRDIRRLRKENKRLKKERERA